MAVLRVLAVTFALAWAGCYSPNAPDCTLACTAATDCVEDQICTTDNLCASATITTCGEHLAPDAGSGSGSGSGSGMPTTVVIKVHLDGQGSLHSSNSDVCDSIAPLVCTFDAPKGQPLTMTAVPHIAKQFDKWMGPPCDMAANGASCTTTPQGTIDVTPKFKN